jgi:magnesium transporter
MIQVHAFRRGTELASAPDLDEAERLMTEDDVFVWLDAEAPSDEDVDAMGAALGLHPLTLEDVRHRRQRPKVELFEGYAVMALRPLALGADLTAEELLECELLAFVGRRFLGTIRFEPDPFTMDQVVRRWRRQPDLLAGEGGGFAAYVLVDEVVDGYLTIVEALEDRADDLEDDVFGDRPDDGGTQLQQRIFRLKREVVRLRRFVSPLRQALDLIQEEPTLAGAPLQPYYRDVTEHVIRVTELADNIRDLLTSLLEVRVSQVANRMNEITKKISAWAGIVLVPTLIAGIYGMNFRGMPELGWSVGYPAALAAMALSAIVLYTMFKRRGWL